VRRLAEVGGVGLLAELVPVAGEDAFRPRPLERDAETANTAKEVNEADFPVCGCAINVVFRRIFAEWVGHSGARRGFAISGMLHLSVVGNKISGLLRFLVVNFE